MTESQTESPTKRARISTAGDLIVLLRCLCERARRALAHAVIWSDTGALVCEERHRLTHHHWVACARVSVAVKYGVKRVQPTHKSRSLTASAHQ